MFMRAFRVERGRDGNGTVMTMNGMTTGTMYDTLR